MTTTASTSTTPSSTPSSIVTVIGKDWSWFLSHLTAIAILAGLLVGLVYFVENLEEKHDAKQAALYSSLASQSSEQVKSLENTLQQDETHWAAVQAQLLSQNSQLAQDVVQKNQQLATQVNTDATLDAQQVADRISQQTQASQGEVGAQQNNIYLSLPVARRVTADLDTLVAVQSNLTSTQTQLQNETTIAGNTQKDLADEKKVTAGLQTTITDNQKACDAKVAAANAKARKAGIKGFFAGSVTVLIAWAEHSI